MSDEVNDFLKGGGAPGVKWPTVATTHQGVIRSAVVTQQTDMVSGLPKFYDDGNPMKQLEVTVITSDRDAEIPNDNGARRIFVKGQMKLAVGEAIREAGQELEVGGTLSVTYIGDKPAKTKGFNPQKQFEATYTPPTAASVSAASSYLSDEEPF